MAKFKVIEGGAPKAPPGGAVVHGDPEFMPLRCAVDWFTLLYEPPVSGGVWKRLARIGAHDGQRVLTLHHDGETFPVEVRTVAGGSMVRLKGPGLFVTIRDPHAPRSDRPGAVYSVEVQVQGTALSASSNGLRVVRWFKAAVESLLYRHYGPNPPERGARLRDYIRPGRFDLATDVAVIAPEPDTARAWVSSEVFASGNINDANARVSTRARKHKGATEVDERAYDNVVPIVQRGKGLRGSGKQATRLVGKESTGRTLYRGGSIVELCVYERDKKRDGDWCVLGPTLTACGWDEVSPVLRWEVRFSRAWFREQVVQLRDGTWKRAHELSVDDVLEHITDFARLASERFRHVVAGPGRVRDRESSPYHKAVVAGLGLLESPERAASVVMDIVSKKREVAAERAASRAAGGIVDVMAVAGVTFAEACLIVYADQFVARHDHYSDRFVYQRARWGLDEAPFLTGELEELDFRVPDFARAG